jgi:hypothetical protein
VYANLRGIFAQVTSTQLVGVGCKVRTSGFPSIDSFKIFTTWGWLSEGHTEKEEFECVEESHGEPQGYLSQYVRPQGRRKTSSLILRGLI